MRALAATGNELTNLRQLKAYADSVTADISEAVAAETSKRELQDELLNKQIAVKLSTVARNDTLSGDGTSGNPMGVGTGMTPATAIYDTSFNLDDVDPAYYGRWVIVGNNTKGTKPESNFMGYCLALVRDANSVSEVVFTSEAADRIYCRRRYDNRWSQWQTVAYLTDLEDLVSDSDLTSRLETALQPYATTSSLTAAIGEESKAREKQDQLLEDEIATKLGVGNIRSGEGIAVSSESTNVTISGTLASQDAPGMMSAADKTRLDGMDEAISSAVSEEASARQNADSGLSDKIDGKIAATDIKAGANISVSTQGNTVTVAATVPDVSGFVTKTAADAAYAPKSHTHTASQITGLTANRALVSDANGHPAVSAVTNTELGYLDGVTSGVQAQINGKLDSDGNAVSASKLQTARTINGTSFDGTANITTANWGASRTITIGEMGKGVNGSGNVSWSLDEIGAAPKSHTHSASQITSGTLDAARIPTITDGKIQSVSASKLTGVIPTANLPGYVDDVLEYDGLDSFPDTGEAGKIYVATDTNRTYRWGGSSYVEISPSLALGTTSSTAFRGDWGQTAYQHAQAKGSAFASGLYKITTNAQGHVTAATAVTKSDITALGIPGQDTNTTYGLSSTSANGLLRQLDGSTSHYMRGDGTWATPPNTTYSPATQSANGLMSAADKKKLDGIASGANNYTLPDATTSVKGGVKVGSGISVSGGTISTSLSNLGVTASATELNYMDGVTANVQNQLNGKAASNHTHNYAGSSSAGGAANSAVKLQTARTINGTSFDGTANITLTGMGAENLDGKSQSLDSLTLSSGTPRIKWYYCPTDGGGASITGRPSDSAKKAFSLQCELSRYVSSSDFVVKQTYVQHDTHQTWVRYGTGSSSGVSWTAWGRVYTSQDKPTASDIGALASNGNAASATKLQTARTISLTGNVTGSASFDGTANASITATIANNAVTTARLADKAVTPAKMASDPVYIVTSASDTTSISGKTVVKPCILVVTGGEVPQIVYAS